MSEEEWSGRPGQLAIDYRFCYGFHLTLFYGNRRMKFWNWIPKQQHFTKRGHTSRAWLLLHVALLLSELASVFACLNYVARLIVNANQSVM